MWADVVPQQLPRSATPPAASQRGGEERVGLGAGRLREEPARLVERPPGIRVNAERNAATGLPEASQVGANRAGRDAVDAEDVGWTRESEEGAGGRGDGLPGEEPPVAVRHERDRDREARLGRGARRRDGLADGVHRLHEDQVAAPLGEPVRLEGVLAGEGRVAGDEVGRIAVLERGE